MTGLGELRARVAARYDRLGMPSWPDPHATNGPLDDEYSRVTDPDRYVIVHTRARLWAEALAELPGVVLEPVAPAGSRITSPLPGTLPLVLLEHDTSPATLRIDVADQHLIALPDCGCDACDRGSADLLQAIDETVTTVVGGPFVLLRGEGWFAYWHPDGGGTSATGPGPDHTAAMDLCRRLAAGEPVGLPGGTHASVGRSWFEMRCEDRAS